MKTTIAITFEGQAANLISDKKKGIVTCKQPFKKKPDFVLDVDEIENIETLTEEQAKDKSVIGRAIVGGLLFGGVGAIVGGISGTGQKRKITEIISIDTTDGKTYLLPVHTGAAAGILLDVKHAKEKRQK